MKRREALSISLAATGGIMLGGSFWQSCSQQPYPYALFTQQDMDILNDLADTLIPDTDTSQGAKKANVGEFVQLYVTDCLAAVQQQIVLEGYARFKKDCLEEWSKPFHRLSAESKQSLVDRLIRESEAHADQQSPHYFGIMRRIILRGYFTSEIGMTQCLRYVPIPGYQKGVIPYQAGEKLWAL
ncbi:MAG: gluconate 2-dehydrogenase subunit 3 family protein [Cyclobacteriaceae bacterium]|nr:gluconate 2-dehydrogenase subunit 3 family protein [Cyclobacteriaceae bacterium]